MHGADAQRRVAERIVAGQSKMDAAATERIPYATVRRWAREPSFRAALRVAELQRARERVESAWPGSTHVADDCDLERVTAAMSPLKGTRLGKR
jgi:hypothetical protein